MKLQGLVRCFEYNNKTYLEIKKNIEQVEFGTSSDQKKIIRLALACLMVSMINNQKKYIFLLSSSSSLANPDIHCEPNLRVESSSKIDYKEIVAAMILLDAEELFTKHAKEITESIITKASSIPSSSLHQFSLFDNKNDRCCP